MEHGIGFDTVLAYAQYDSSTVRETVEKYGAEPVIPYRKSSKIKKGIRIGCDFVVHGVQRLVNLFRKRVSLKGCLAEPKSGFS